MDGRHFLNAGESANVNINGVDLYVVRMRHTMAYTCSVKDKVILDRDPDQFIRKVESYLEYGERGLYLNG